MIFLPHNLFHVSVQMLPKQFTIRLLIQQPLKKLIHIMKHILQGFVQLLCIHQGSPQHIQVDFRIILK